jgi:hypothetical protein
MRRTLPLRVALLALAVHSAACSYGDMQPGFQRCLQQCAATGCAAPGACVASCAASRGGVAGDLARSERVMRWDCAVRGLALRSRWPALTTHAQADCRYRCMHVAEAASGAPPVKYYGKWPFARALGLQARLLCVRRRATHEADASSAHRSQRPWPRRWQTCGRTGAGLHACERRWRRRTRCARCGRATRC